MAPEPLPARDPRTGKVEQPGQSPRGAPQLLPDLHKRHSAVVSASSAAAPSLPSADASGGGNGGIGSGGGFDAAGSAARQHVLDRDFGLHFFGSHGQHHHAGGAGSSSSSCGAMGGDFAEAHLPWVGPLSLKTLAVAALFALGTVVYRWTERLTWVDAAYCTTGVLTTVGQVIVPTTPAGRAFTALFNLASMGVTVLFIMEIADGRRDAARRALRRGGGLAGASNRMEVLVLLAATVPPVVVMAAVLQYLEGWHSYAEALYFCIITASGALAAGARRCRGGGVEARRAKVSRLTPTVTATTTARPSRAQAWAWATWSRGGRCRACSSSATCLQRWG